jgi:hypothetical protein
LDLSPCQRRPRPLGDQTALLLGEGSVEGQHGGVGIPLPVRRR